MADPIRLSDEPTKRGLNQVVTVQVEVRPEQLANTLTRDEVVRLCARHNILLKGNGGRGGPKTKIAKHDMDRIADDLRSGDIEGALIGLERVLPREFRHLAEDVARFYRARA